MKSGLTADQELLVATTRKFLQDTVPTATLRDLRDTADGYRPEYWATGAELGWTSLLVAEKHGGGTVSGDGLRDLALVAREFGRAAAPGPLLGTNVVAAALSRVGDDRALCALDPLVSGEAVAAWCPAAPELTGLPGAGSVVARPAGPDWIVSGGTAPVEHGAQASLFLVTARAPGGMLQLLVPATSVGVVTRPLSSIDVSRRFARVDFNDVQVPATSLLGEPDAATTEIERQVCDALVIQLAEMVGAMDRAFDLTVAWAADRYSFGRPLASYQALKHRFASMKMWLEASHALVDAVTTAVCDDLGRAIEMVSVAKSYIGDRGPELCQECVQLHGGIGLTYEHDLHLYLRRVALSSMLLGTPRQHRMRLADLIERRDIEQEPSSDDR
ncbi:acyl-CoA/acyl-ACP dehydrogenase [Frankia sp. AgB1.9]|uniref:acyl-CoA dehydrogenase family protein n=1 Tax=unclassified Frankia TaxID=2632575 RepID=UPI001933FDA2|nr:MULTISPECIES: acyl-CoA dehydrogenase family protein [unclassified Frankia]MBL7488105.1 acyl-CoA/acyl-ACP dehydrogenase [Frankia sp. AgW1.1]MBL7553263.1 acyl-CoA/acyl-ACP dehydrogenase [Frankia sp. AgB1.9]MBL7624241.1 acyl-CoA/acyl-ACP dehydrogenase [Frankia sp. AgB1.8]